MYINKLFYSFYLFLFFSTCRWRYTWFGFFTDFEMCQQNVYDNHFFRTSVCLSVLLKYNTFQFIQMKSSWNSKQQTLIKWMFKIVDKNLWEDWGVKIVNQTVKFMVWQNLQIFYSNIFLSFFLCFCKNALIFVMLLGLINTYINILFCNFY